MSGSGKGFLGLWLYRSGNQEWALKEGSPLHQRKNFIINDPGNGNGHGSDRTSIIFTLKNQVGGLARALQVFQELGINVLHVELRPSENAQQGDVLVDIECDANHLEQVLKMLRREVNAISYANATQVAEDYPPPTPLSAQSSFGEELL